MKRLVSLLFLLCLCPALAQAVPQSCVVLLHGLARSESSMDKMAAQLQASGYEVVNQCYPSRQYPIEALAALAIEPAIKSCHASPVHFVTHSLGGILLRYYLDQQQPDNLGRVVMLGPPNQGSEVVDVMHGWPGFYWLNGPAGQQLGTDEASWPQRLGAAEYEVGVIAGNHSINWILSMMIPGEDDGKVAVARTRLEGMKDAMTLPVSHPFLMKNQQVIDQVQHFLQQGCFDHSGDNPASEFPLC